MERTFATLVAAVTMVGLAFTPAAAAEHDPDPFEERHCAGPMKTICETEEDLFAEAGKVHFCDTDEVGVTYDGSEICAPLPNPEDCPYRTGVRDENYGSYCVNLHRHCENAEGTVNGVLEQVDDRLAGLETAC